MTNPTSAPTASERAHDPARRDAAPAAAGQTQGEAPQWGDLARYLTDDRDKGDRYELVIYAGGNGDYYVATVLEGHRPWREAVRICTSGGAASRAPGVVLGVSQMYRALLGLPEQGDADAEFAALQAAIGRAAPPPAPEPVGERGEDGGVLPRFAGAVYSYLLRLEQGEFGPSEEEHHALRAAALEFRDAAPPAAPTPTGERALREALERIVGMCDVGPTCTCGRPNGLRAVVACASAALAATPAPGGAE